MSDDLPQIRGERSALKRKDRRRGESNTLLGGEKEDGVILLPVEGRKSSFRCSSQEKNNNER